MKNLAIATPKKAKAKVRRARATPAPRVLIPSSGEASGVISAIHRDIGCVAIQTPRSKRLTLFRWRPETMVVRNNYIYGRETLRPGEKVTIAFESGVDLPLAKKICVTSEIVREDLGVPDFETRAPRGGRHHRAARVP